MSEFEWVKMSDGDVVYVPTEIAANMRASKAAPAETAPVRKTRRRRKSD